MSLKPTQITALKAEIVTDPAGLGLTLLLAQGAISEITTRLNTRFPDVQGYNPAATAAAYQVNEDAASTDALVAAMDPADWAGMTVTAQEYFKLLASCGTLAVRTYHRAWVTANVPGGNGTNNSRQRVQDVLTRDGSRAEKLFGSGTQLTDDDVVAARNLP